MVPRKSDCATSFLTKELWTHRIGNFASFFNLAYSVYLSYFFRGSQKDYRKDVSIGTKVDCWFVHNNGQGLIDGVHGDYIVPNLL